MMDMVTVRGAGLPGGSAGWKVRRARAMPVRVVGEASGGFSRAIRDACHDRRSCVTDGGVDGTADDLAGCCGAGLMEVLVSAWVSETP